MGIGARLVGIGERSPSLYSSVQDDVERYGAILGALKVGENGHRSQD